MRNRFIILITLLISFACSNKVEEKSELPMAQLEQKKTLNLVIEDRIVDSTNVGIPGKYKMDIKQVRFPDSVIVELDLFEKKDSKWQKIQSLRQQKEGISGLDLLLTDYNNDKMNDVSFVGTTAANLSNEKRQLLIFQDGLLKLIKNSLHYSNFRYNKELNCIDAWLIYGGSSTVFLKLQGDSLAEFANIELYDNHMIVTEIGKNGKRKILLKTDQMKYDVYTRFLNYKPVVADL